MLGKLLYALLFVFIIPFLLIIWAISIENTVLLPVYFNPKLGLILFTFGSIFMFLGMIALFKYGNGLPMNAFPPEKFVQKGIYKLLAHPIYIGVSIISIGLSVFIGSSAGLWVISPILILGCIALVLGYEKRDLELRFAKIEYKRLLMFPENSDDKLSAWNIISAFVLVLIPWLILYQIVIYFGIPVIAIESYLPFENQIPVIEFTEIFYILIYPLIIIFPFIAKEKRILRSFMLSGITATAIGIFLQLTIPFIATPREFEATSFLGELLLLEREYDAPVAAFPAFHVTWAFIMASSYSRRFNSLKIIWYILAILISLTCITTSMHSIVDVIMGYILFLISNEPGNVWRKICDFFERIANSWKEWHLGKIRIINHGFYAGIAATVGILFAGILLGPAHYSAIAVTAIISLLFAGIWAQVIEGSDQLLRPFGYYGNVIGIFIGAAISHFYLGTHFFIIMSAFAIAGPWIQAIGRMRCLVQGCCHGRECDDNIGIKYFHERSRVTRLTELGGKKLYPTPVYSIIANVVIGILLLRLWFSGMPLPFILGMYMILAGFSRFVEEDYRGEPQTPKHLGLRLYQWTSIFSVIIGAYFTMIKFNFLYPEMTIDLSNVIISISVGLLTCFLMGIDFPKSNKRFSRLV